MQDVHISETPRPSAEINHYCKLYSFSLEDQGCSYLKLLNLFQFPFSDRDYGEMEKLFYEEGDTPLLESEENFKLFLERIILLILNML